MSGESPPAPTSQAVDPVDAAVSATAVAIENATPHSLHSAVYARRAEYVRPHRVRVKVGTWNVAACPGTDQDLASWFVDGKGIDRRLANVTGGHGALERYTSNADDEEEAATPTESHYNQNERVRVIGHDKVGLYVLGLQEVIDLKLASQYMSRVYAADPSSSVIDKWRATIEDSLPTGYQLVASEHMSGLLLLVYASPEIAPMVSHTSTSAVGTGLLGMLGNKGAVSASVVLGEATRMVFVNSHLASGSDASHSERRCWDFGQIESRTQFEPYLHPGAPRDDKRDHDKIDDADFAFWFGDLNFRLEGLPGDDIRRILTLHTRGEYDLSRPHAAVPDQNPTGHGSGGIDTSLAGEEAVVLKSPNSTAAAYDKRTSWASTTTAANRASMDTVDTASTAFTQAGDGAAGDSDDDSDAQDAADNMKKLPPLPPRPDMVNDDGLEELPDPDDFVPDPSEDPASLQATLDSLLPHDQLHRIIKERRAFSEGWREGRITFLPSYKYDVGTVGLFDSSEKRRAPSWCDRVLYRTRKDKEEHDQRIRDEEEAKKRDEDMKSRGLDRAGDDDDVLFEYQPDESEFPHRSVSGSASGSGSLEYDEYDDAVDATSAGPAEYEPYDEGDDDAAAAAAAAAGTAGDRIQQDLYTSHQRIQSSDHKPVVALFTVDFDAAVPELKATVLAEVAKELDRTENESRPGITIVVDSRARDKMLSGSGSDDAAVDLGPLTFSQRATASLTIANTGRVPAVFSFVEKPSTEDLGASGSLVHPYEWLKTSFEREDGTRGDGDNEAGGSVDGAETHGLGKEVVLDPGETVNALLEAVVDDLVFARMLNEGASSLDEVFVLRVLDGRDHFVPVRATWPATCIGRSVEELVRVPDGGIRRFMQELAEDEGQKKKTPQGGKAGLGAYLGSSHSISYELDVRHSAPKELFKLTEAIENLTDRAIADEQMLDDYKIPSADTSPGWPFERTTASPLSAMYRYHTVAVIDALDTDRPLSDAFAPEVPSLLRLEVVAGVLLLFLRGLTDGVVSIPLWSRIDQSPLATLGNSSYSSASAALVSPACKSAAEADKNAVLDILSAAPHHNILFVFLTATLSRMVGELSPLSLGDVDALRAISRSKTGVSTPVSGGGSAGGGGSGFAAALGGIGNLGRAFRKTTITAATSTNPSSGAALAALERRMARERRYAEIFGSAMCRASPSLTSKDKDRRVQEDKQRAVVEMFLRRTRDELI